RAPARTAAVAVAHEDLLAHPFRRLLSFHISAGAGGLARLASPPRLAVLDDVDLAIAVDHLRDDLRKLSRALDSLQVGFSAVRATIDDDPVERIIETLTTLHRSVAPGPKHQVSRHLHHVRVGQDLA